MGLVRLILTTRSVANYGGKREKHSFIDSSLALHVRVFVVCLGAAGERFKL